MDFTASIFKRRMIDGLENFKKSTDQKSDFSDLLHINGDVEFVTEAYRRILHREADPGGLSHYSVRVRDGYSRVAMLRQLTQSEEALLKNRISTSLTKSNATQSSWLNNLKMWVFRRLLPLQEFTLRALRIERIELKLDYAAAEMVAQANRQSAKLDSALVTISKKLDRYILGSNANQLQVTEAVPGSDAEHRKYQGEQMEPMNHRLDQIEARIDDLVKAQRPPVFLAGDNIVATEVDGFILGIPADEWRLAAYYALRGVPEPGMVKVFREMVKPGMTVVDVGAHIGLYSLYALRCLQGVGKVFSFEPSPRTFAILKDNIQVNGFRESGLSQLLPVAVSFQSGTAELTIVRHNSGHNTLFGDDLTAEKIQITTVTLDRALINEPKVDVVKIDAEGAEPFILKGMASLRIKNPQLRIFLEFAPEHLSRAGVNPRKWAKEILSTGFVHRIEDVSGELLSVTAEDLAGCISWNLLLSPKLP